MAVTITGGGSDRRQPLSAERNLVPYSDAQKPLPRKDGALVIASDGILFDNILRTTDTAVGVGFPTLSLFDAVHGS